jgi:hypothetical protein
MWRGGHATRVRVSSIARAAEREDTGHLESSMAPAPSAGNRHATPLPNPPDCQVDRPRAVRARAGGVGDQHAVVGFLDVVQRHVYESEALSGLCRTFAHCRRPVRNVDASARGSRPASSTKPFSLAACCGAFRASLAHQRRGGRPAVLDCRYPSLDSLPPARRSHGPFVAP